jgi:hypothetical protein
MALFDPPSFVSSLRDAKAWSLDWISQNQVEGPFKYLILLKAGDGYTCHGEFATATEAFAARRDLVGSTGVTKYFLRAVRVRPVEDVTGGSFDAETREDLDRWRDALATGDESLLSSKEVPAYRRWASRNVPY